MGSPLTPMGPHLGPALGAAILHLTHSLPIVRKDRSEDNPLVATRSWSSVKLSDRPSKYRGPQAVICGLFNRGKNRAPALLAHAGTVGTGCDPYRNAMTKRDANHPVVRLCACLNARSGSTVSLMALRVGVPCLTPVRRDSIPTNRLQRSDIHANSR